MEQRLKCPDCSTRREESDPKQGGDLHAYHIETFTCYVCQNTEQTFEDARVKTGKKKGQLPQGFKARAVPNRIWRERQRIKRQKAIMAERGEAVEKAQARRERYDKA